MISCLSRTPTASWSEPFARKCSQWWTRSYASVATNGIWSKEILDSLCAENGLWVICSVDGTRETHNRYRPGTFDTIIRNLKHLKRANPTVRVRLTTVLTQENKREMFAPVRICRRWARRASR